MQASWLPKTWLATVAVTAAAFLLLWPPIGQDQAYHRFADGRTLWGIANFWNTVSNLPFLAVGSFGILRARDLPPRILFAGVLATAFGSGYYHLAPDDARLTWDRLPMTVAFMALTSLLISRWVSPTLGRKLLVPLLAFGAGSILWWRLGGDLRWYGVAQFGPLLIALPAMWTSPAVRGLWPAVLFYALAKIAEAYDTALAALLPLSGHTIKHLLAAVAAYWILRWILRWNSTYSATAPPNSAPPAAGTPTGA